MFSQREIARALVREITVFTGISRTFVTIKTVDAAPDTQILARRKDPPVMHAKERSSNPFREDPPDENPMEARVSKVESDIAAMQVDIREIRGDMKAANESIADLKAAVATVDGKINALDVKIDCKVDATG